MKRQYVTADVFTSNRFEGNPVAVVLEAEGLSARQMQSIASEFAHPETAFVLPCCSNEKMAQIRIFTPRYEIPFSVNAVVAVTFVIASQTERFGVELPAEVIFELQAGDVSARVLRDGTEVIGAEITLAESFRSFAEVSPQAAALCLSLSPKDIKTLLHAPQVASTGLPYLVVELASREALRACIPNRSGLTALLPVDGATSIYVYTRDVARCERATDIQARVFTKECEEKSSVAKATTAAVALLATAEGVDELSLRIGHGTEMGRPSQLFMQMQIDAEKLVVQLGGNCVEVLEGTFTMRGDTPPLRGCGERCIPLLNPSFPSPAELFRLFR